MESFSLFAHFEPSVELADILIQSFHLPHRQMQMEYANGTHSKQTSTSTCTTDWYGDRITYGLAPWNTDYGIGCLGDASDFE